MRRLALFLVKFAVLLGVFLFAAQDLLIFPGVRLKSPGRLRQDTSLAKRFQPSYFVVETEDKERIDVLHYPPVKEIGNKYAALIFHGNYQTVEHCRYMQLWLAEMGIPNYVFDYRGYGRSSGWPSERGLELDAEAVWNFVSEREAIPNKQWIIIGKSVGTGPAAFLASKVSPGALVLIAPYSSMKAAVSDRRLFRLFTFLLRYKLPTADYVADLNDTCLILAHGGLDQTIASYHSGIVAQSYQGPFLRDLSLANAGHNDIFGKSKAGIQRYIFSCFEAVQ